jgi:PAS domain S-box-containing protein
MTLVHDQIQVLYEIALSIGEGDKLNAIARNALSAYLRKLNCSSGAVLQKLNESGNTEQFKTITSIPTRIEKNKIFQEAILAISKNTEAKDGFNSQLPISNTVGVDGHYYIMDLPDFGLIILTKSGSELTFDTLSLLEPLNRKLAQSCSAELTKERDHLQSAALKNTANAIVITDVEGTIEWVNQAWCSLSGYSKEEAINQNPGIFKSDHHDKAFYTEMWTTILSGNVWHGDLMNKRKDDNLYIEEMTITPLFDDKGAITHFIGVKQDITERKDIENKLLESEEKFRSIIENANDGIYLRDLDGVITFANEKFASIHGYSLKEVIGRKSWEFLHPEDLTKIKDTGEFDKVQSGEFTEGEERGLTKDGEVIYLDIRTAPFMLDLNIIGVFGIIRDITKRKQNEEKIRESEERFKSIANLLPQPIWETNLNGYYTYTNRAGHKQFGYTKADISKGVFVTDLIAPEDRERAMTSFKKSYKEKNFKVRQFNCIKKDGSRFPALIYYDSILKEGSSIGIRGITVDITDLKQIQDELIVSQENLTVQNKKYETLNEELISINERLTKAKESAESAEKAQADFLSTMSHEIRTPMNAVVGLTNILLTENPQDYQLSNLKTLEFSSQNLLNIINDILNFNKLESGNVILENIDFSIKEVLHGIFYAMKPLADEKNIDLSINIDESIPVNLVGDSTRLMQIINNLVSNCIKFTTKGGVVVHVSKEKEKGNEIWTHFEISDTGIGIAKENMSKIFDAFKQAKNSTSRLYGGTGLGLPIVKKLLELQKSRIKVKSEIDVGSTFSFTIKYRKGEGLDKAAEPLFLVAEDDSLNNVEILLVEDNKINQLVARQFLDRWGCVYEIADNGEIALEKLKERTYQVILMDLQMPVLDGYQTTKKIRSSKDKKISGLPIIALSASALMEIKEKAKKIGMDGFVTKPFVPVQLFNTIKQSVYKSS